MRWQWLFVLIAAGLLAGAPRALASGGDYSVVGATPYEQQQVESALNASAFDWSLVPGPVTIHVAPGIAQGSYSTPGHIYLDAQLLDTGTFSWGVVQMEYAQQVQLALLTPAMKQKLTTALVGSQQWCYENPSLPRGANACERFAATLAWAYWQSPKNCMQPAGTSDWSASMRPDAFQQALSEMIGAPVPQQAGPQQRVLAAFRPNAETRTRADGSRFLSITVPGAGVVIVSGLGIGSAVKSATRAGSIGVWVTPATRLRPGSRRIVLVTVTYTPVGGLPIRAMQRLPLAAASRLASKP